MKSAAIVVFLFFMPLLLLAQLGAGAKLSFYMPIHGKHLELKVNKTYYFSLNQKGMQKLSLPIGESRHRFMKITNQIGDTLFFEEGKLFKEDLDSVLYVNPKRYWFIVIAGYTYLPFTITYALRFPQNKVYLYLLIPPATIVTNVLLSRVKKKFINLKDYELIPQNIHGKPPQMGW
jgi:hypothetical protein